MKKLSKIILFLTITVFLGNGTAHANETSDPSLREIVVFGESSSDTGNVFEEQCPPNSGMGSMGAMQHLGLLAGTRK